MMTSSCEYSSIIHDSPARFLRIAVREAKYRARLCEQYSTVLDEIALTEESFGKSIVKTSSTNRTHSRDGWPSTANALWDNFCSAQERLGKQHIGFSLCISQSISRELSDQGRLSSRHIEDIQNKTQTVLDMLMKSSRHYKKKYAKYIRLIQDAEASIAARDGAIGDYAEKINAQSEDAQMFGSFNRSLTKVLGKFAPTDALQKQHDRCRHLLHELGVIEGELQTATLDLIVQQKEYKEQTRKALRDIEDLEQRRLEFLKESILRFCQATEGMNDHMREILLTLTGRASAANMQLDMEQLERDITAMRIKPLSVARNAIAIVGGDGAGDGDAVESMVEPSPTAPLPVEGHPEDDLTFRLRSNMLSLDRIRDALECLRHATQRATSAFIDFGDMEKHYAKLAAKGLEKHGYVGQRSTGSHSISVSTMKKPSDSKCADSVDLYELPLITQGWNGMIEFIQRLTESHHTSAAVLVEKCSIMSDSIMRRLDVSLKTVNDTLTDVNKRVETAKATQVKLASKLTRVRKELKDRRLASVGAIAHPPVSHGGNRHVIQRNDSCNGSESCDAFEREMYDTESSPARRAGESAESRPAEGPPSIEKMERRRSEKGVIHGLESLSTAFGAAAVTALGAAGVLESSNERNISRIAGLEEDERTYVESLDGAVTATAAVIQTCVVDLLKCIDSIKGGVSSEVDNLKSSYMLMLDSSMMGVNTTIAAVAKLKKCAQNIEVGSDLKCFLSVVEKAHPLSLEEERKIQLAVEAFDSYIDDFVKIENELVDFERQSEKESVVNEDPLNQDSGGSGSLYAATTIGTGLRGRSNFPTAKPRRSRSAGDSVEVADAAMSPPELVDEETGKIRVEHRHSDSSIAADTTLPAPASIGNTEEMALPPDVASVVSTSPSPIRPLSPVRTSRHSSDSVDDESVEFDSKHPLDSAEATSEEFLPITEGDNEAKLMSSAESEECAGTAMQQEKSTVDIPSDLSSNYVTDTAESLIRVSYSSSDTTSHVETPPRSSLSPESSPARKAHESSSSRQDVYRNDFSRKGISGAVSPISTSHLTSPELVKFDLPPDEKVVEYFSCAIYPKRGLLTHGRMFITNHHVAFSGWPEVRILISFKDIENVEKKQMFFLPNALTIREANGEEYFFGSFLDRDLCYRMVTSLVMIEKSIVQLTEESSDTTSRAVSTPVKSLKEQSAGGGNGGGPQIEKDGDGVIAQPESDDDSHDPVDYKKIFDSSGVATVFNDSIAIPSSTIWRRCWNNLEHFEGFLKSEGDFDIVGTEWSPFTATLTAAQNPAGFKFQYFRTVTYLHPRTSMLMFGPKNATAKQLQYLYLPSLGDVAAPNVSDITASVPSGVILTATQFEGIPMCDVFEVLMYWSFRATSPNGGHAGNRSRIVIGCAVNYLKSTLLKSQIFAGTKEELEVLSKNWVSFVLRSHITAEEHSSQVPSIATNESGPLAPSAVRPRRDSGPGQVSPEETVTISHIQRDATSSLLQSKEWRIVLGLIIIVVVIQMALMYGLYLHASRYDEQILELLKLVAENISGKDHMKCTLDNSD